MQLNLAGAETVLEAAKKKAAALGLKCNVAVVDDGGRMLAFARMDGARPASAATALTKAVSAATFRQETGPLPAKGEPDVLLSLSIQNASGGKITTLKGGVPTVIDGQVVGAVGVGGGTGEQDADVAHLAGLAKLAHLDLGYNPGVTDAGLKHLTGLRQLTGLRLYGTKVTDDGAAGLKGALPKVVVGK